MANELTGWGGMRDVGGRGLAVIGGLVSQVAPATPGLQVVTHKRMWDRDECNRPSFRRRSLYSPSHEASRAKQAELRSKRASWSSFPHLQLPNPVEAPPESIRARRSISTEDVNAKPTRSGYDLFRASTSSIKSAVLSLVRKSSINLSSNSSTSASSRRDSDFSSRGSSVCGSGDKGAFQSAFVDKSFATDVRRSVCSTAVSTSTNCSTSNFNKSVEVSNSIKQRSMKSSSHINGLATCKAPMQPLLKASNKLIQQKLELNNVNVRTAPKIIFAHKKTPECEIRTRQQVLNDLQIAKKEGNIVHGKHQLLDHFFSSMKSKSKLNSSQPDRSDISSDSFPSRFDKRNRSTRASSDLNLRASFLSKDARSRFQNAIKRGFSREQTSCANACSLPCFSAADVIRYPTQKHFAESQQASFHSNSTNLFKHDREVYLTKSNPNIVDDEALNQPQCVLNSVSKCASKFDKISPMSLVGYSDFLSPALEFDAMADTIAEEDSDCDMEGQSYEDESINFENNIEESIERLTEEVDARTSQDININFPEEKFSRNRETRKHHLDDQRELFREERHFRKVDDNCKVDTSCTFRHKPVTTVEDPSLHIPSSNHSRDMPLVPEEAELIPVKREKPKLTLNFASRSFIQKGPHLSLLQESDEAAHSECGVQLRTPPVGTPATPQSPRSPALDIAALFEQKQQEAGQHLPDEMARVQQLLQRLHLPKCRPSCEDSLLNSCMKSEAHLLAEKFAPRVIEGNTPVCRNARSENNSNANGSSSSSSCSSCSSVSDSKCLPELTAKQRRDNLQRAIAWVRRELLEMKKQDCQIAQQLVRLRVEVQKLRLLHSVSAHQAMLQDVTSTAVVRRLFTESDLCEPPADFSNAMSPLLHDIGVTPMNIDHRRFSLR